MGFALEQSHDRTKAPRQIAVLIVDDDEDVAEVVAGMLEDLGCVVTTCNDVPSAIQLLSVGPLPDVVLSDVRMPGNKNGIDLARVVRQRYPDLFFAFMSGFPDVAFAEFGCELLSKPVTPRMLANLLARIPRRASA